MENFIEYKATGRCSQFQNIFYTALATDIKVTINGAETTAYTWVYGLKYVQLNDMPADGDRVRITNINLVTDPNPDMEVLRNDVSANEQNIISLENAIALLQGRDNVLAVGISDLEDAGTVQDTQLNQLSAKNILQDTAIAGLVVDLDAAEIQIQSNVDAIANLSDQEAAVTDLQARMTATEADLITLGNYSLANRDLILEDRARLNSLEAKYDHVATAERDILNNQTVPLAIYDGGKGDTLLVDADTEDSATMAVEYIRRTDAGDIRTLVDYALMFDGTAWHITRVSTVSPTDTPIDGVTLSMTTTVNAGNIFYVSDDMLGANYSGTMRVKLYKTRNTL